MASSAIYHGNWPLKESFEYQMSWIMEEFKWHEIEDIFKTLWLHLDDECDEVGHIATLRLPSYGKLRILNELMGMVPELLKFYSYKQFEDMVSNEYGYAEEEGCSSFRREPDCEYNPEDRDDYY